MRNPQPSLFDDASDSATLLDELWSRNEIQLRRGKIFYMPPSSVDVAGLAKSDRIPGMLMGVAVGDSLGFSTEHRFDPQSRYENFGTIVDHLKSEDVRAGRISDDSQMTFWMLERLLAKRQLDFDDMVGRFVDRQSLIVGMGQNTSASLSRHRTRLRGGGLSIAQCVGDPLVEGRGNGALMRFSPVVLPHLKSPSSNLWTDAVASAFITHGNTVALSSIVPMIYLLWETIRRRSGEVPSPMWWIDEYVRVGGDLEAGPLPCPLNTEPIPKWYMGFRGTLCDFVDTVVRRALRDGVPLRDACSLDGFGSRADCTQTVPAVLYTLACHADSFSAAIIAAVNDTKDNDTIAAIVGAFVGAIHGKQAIRRRWIDGITSYSLKIHGREAMSDRSVMEEMSESASILFVG